MTTTIGSLDLNALSDLYNDSNQYFWFEGDASATYGAGVHITLSPDTSFIANPTGQNILMNTDGISIRNGLLPMMALDNDSLDFNVINATTGTYNNVASFGSTAIVIGEEAKANLHLTFNNLSMVDKDGAKFFEVGDNRNADGMATIKYTEIVTVNGAGRVIVTVNSNISSIVSVYADSVQLSSSQYSFSGKNVTINGLTADSKKTIKITYTTTESIVYLTFGERASSGNIGNYSVAEGTATTASGDSSHAEGKSTTASGNSSHAEGGDTTASGNFSHAEGSGTTASVYGSHAEGTATTASEYCSHAEGNATTASGIFSHAEGKDTTASGNSSHAGGNATVADGFCMTAIGKYNTLNSGKAFVIGNGTSNTARSDAFTVDWDGGLTLGTALSIANGGTGATTVADARNALGLGNTSGAVPVANGGTGKTTHTSNSVLTGNGKSKLKNVASADGALYATSANGAPKFGTLPIAQGGTGATTAAAACSNLGIADYIVEQGTSGIWTYKKWNSGIVEAWANVSTTQAIATALGNVYRAPNAVTTNFPFTITQPKVHLASQSGVVNGAYIAELSNASFIWYPIKYGKDTASKVRTIAAYVNGKWK